MDKSAFVRVQVRVSRRASPALYDYLTVAAKNGESESSALKRLAEEALMLRSHPLIKAVQAIDLKEENSKTLLSSLKEESNIAEKKFFSERAEEKNALDPNDVPPAPERKALDADAGESKGDETLPAPAHADGGSALAALLVARTRGLIGSVRS